MPKKKRSPHPLIPSHGGECEDSEGRSPYPFDPLPRRGIAEEREFAPPLISPPTEGNSGGERIRPTPLIPSHGGELYAANEKAANRDTEKVVERETANRDTGKVEERETADRDTGKVGERETADRDKEKVGERETADRDKEKE
jgi:hypothetical protein